MYTRLLIFTTILIMFSLSSCYYDKGDKLYPNPAPCDTNSMSYTADIKPLIQTNCLAKGCHTSANPSGLINLETYSSVTPTIAGNKLINALKYASGGSKNMPPTGKLTDCEIAKVEAWIKNGYPEN